MINYLAYVDGNERSHIGNNAAPTSLYIIFGITISTAAVVFMVTCLLSKITKTADEDA